jgi:hypothetical protein
MQTQNPNHLLALLTGFILALPATSLAQRIYHTDPNARINLVPDHVDMPNKFFVWNGYSTPKTVLATKTGSVDTLIITAKDYLILDSHILEIRIYTTQQNFSVLTPAAGSIYKINYNKEQHKYIIEKYAD